jgi:hypothetical protein
MVHWLVWPWMRWSTDPDHNVVHVQVREHMHVHAQWCGDYTTGR